VSRVRLRSLSGRYNIRVTEVAAKPTLPAIEITGTPTALYRFYDRDDALLYVGVSGNPTIRWADHAAEKHWWSQVVRKTIVLYGSRMEAEVAEGIAIRSESPTYNLAQGRRDPAEIPARKAAVHRKPAAAGGPSLRFPSREAWYGLGPYQPFIQEYAKRQGCSEVEAAGRLLFAGVVHDYLDRLDDEGLAALEADVRLHMSPAKRR